MIETKEKFIELMDNKLTIYRKSFENYNSQVKKCNTLIDNIYRLIGAIEFFNDSEREKLLIKSLFEPEEIITKLKDNIEQIKKDKKNNMDLSNVVSVQFDAAKELKEDIVRMNENDVNILLQDIRN